MNMNPLQPPSPPGPVVIPPEEPQGGQTTKNKLFIIGGIVLLVVVIALAASYGTFLGAKIAPGNKFKILGPSALKAGQTATITWDASPQNVKQYPYEKIEYCNGKASKQKCAVLAVAALNNGKLAVKVPQSLSPSRGYLKFTARDAQKKLVGSMVGTSKTVTIKQAETESAESDTGGGGGGSGGGGGGGGGDGGGGSPQQPSTAPQVSVEFILPVDNERISASEDSDVRVQLTHITGMDLNCQQWKLNGQILTINDWEGGQSPDLSAGPCH